MRSGCQHSWVLGEAPLSGLQPANHLLIVWFRSSWMRGGWRERKNKGEREGKREEMLSYISTYRALILLWESSMCMICLPPKGHVTKTITPRIRVSHMNFGGPQTTTETTILAGMSDVIVRHLGPCQQGPPPEDDETRQKEHDLPPIVQLPVY